MTIDSLLTLLTQIIFLLVAGSTVFNWVKYQTRARFDIALVFLSLAIAIIAQELQRILPDLAPVLTLIFLIALLIQPYFLLRLVRYFHPISNLIQRAALMGLLVVVASFALSQTAPILVSILAVVYFFTLEGYVAILLVRGARAIRGVLGKRLQLAAIGSSLLALIFFLSLVFALISATANLPSNAQPWVRSILQLLAILSGLSYYFGFSTPRWLRQNWQFRELYHFLQDISKKPQRDRSTMFEDLATAALRTVGGATAIVAGWDAEQQRLTVEVPGILPGQRESLETETGAIAEAWRDKKARLAHVARELGPDTSAWANEFGVRTLFIIPILSSFQPWGMLVVALRYEPLFDEDDLDLLVLLAGETAASLEKSALINELRITNQSLEQRVRERTSQLESEIAERKQAEGQIRYQADLLQNISDAVIATDSNFNVTHWNRAAETLYGWSAAEVIGRPSRDVLLTEYLETPEQETRERLLRRGTWTGEVIHKHRDGARIHILSSVSLLKDEGRNIIGVVSVNRNITERKQMEEQLRQSQESFSKAFSSSPTALMITRLADGKYIELNEAYTSIVGYDRTELIGHLTTEFNIYVNPDQRKEIVSQLLTNGSLYNYETTIQNKSGSLHTVLASLEMIRFNGEDSVLTTLLDITERKQAEERLNASEELFRTAFESSPMGFCLTGLDGKLLKVNQALCNLLGYTQTELEQKHFEDITHPQDREIGRIAMQQMLSGEVINARFEKRYLRKTGEPVWALVSSATLNDQYGKPMHFVTQILDITDRKRAEEQNRFHANLVASVTDAIIAVDMNLNIQSWNGGAEAMYGWAAEEVIGQPARKFLNTEFLETSRESATKQVLEKGFWVGEVLQQRRNEVSIPALSSLALYRDSEGNPAGIVAVNRDIRERKQAQEQFRLAVEAAPNAIVLMNTDGRISLVNSQAEKFFGYDRTELIGLDIDQLVPERYRGIHSGHRQSFLADPQTRPMGVGRDLYGVRKDGSEFPIEIGLTPLETREGLVVMATIVDITERKQAEEQFHLAVESAPNAIVLVTGEGKIRLVNSQAERFFRYDRAELIGLNVDNLVPEQFRAIHKDYREGFIADPQVRSMGVGRDLYAIRKDSSVFPVEIGLTPIETRDGLLVMATIVDITERKHAEQKLQEQNQRLKALREIDTAILASDSIESIVSVALSHIRDLVNCQRASLTLIDSSADEAITFAVSATNETLIPTGTRIPLSLFQDMLQSLSQNQPVLMNDLSTWADPPPLIQSGIKAGLRSICVLPLFSQSNLIGVFSLSSELPDYFDEEKINLGREVANQVAIAITQSNLLNALREINAELEQRVVQRTAELSEANMLLQAMLDNIPDQIYFKDLNSRFIRNSRSQAKLMGLNDPAEVIGKSDFDFFPHAQRAFEEEQALMRAAKPLIDLEEFVIWPDGQQMWVSTTKVPLHDREGQIIGIMGISRDITERKRVEAEVRRLNQELERNRKDIQGILDSMSTLNAKVALDGTLLFVNKIATQAAGLPLSELMETNFLEGPWWSFDPKVQARVKEAFKQACAGNTISYDEKIYVFGQVLTISFSLTPMLGGDGKVEYILAEGRDISQLKQVEESLRLKTVQLEATNKELEAFSYSVSHDLRAPLRAINGFSQALSGKYASSLEEQGRHYLTRIQANTQQMGELIDDLLSLSRISRREMRQDNVNLTEIAREIDKELRAQEPGRQVLFEVEGQLVATGDAGLIRIVLQNLLTNAWKFTSTRPQAHILFGTLPSSTTQEGGFEKAQVFFVRDNGVGFDMAFANKLFGAFQRLHSTEEFPGTGIGLATVQRSIHRHGGKIWAEAELDKGATFYFTLGGRDES